MSKDRDVLQYSLFKLQEIKQAASFGRMGIFPVQPFCFQTRALFQQKAFRFRKNAPTMDDLSKTSRVQENRPEWPILFCFDLAV